MNLKEIPFAAINKQTLKGYESIRKEAAAWRALHQPDILFVHINQINHKASVLAKEAFGSKWKYSEFHSCNIFAHSPGFLHSSWKTSFEKGNVMKFSTGGYHSTIRLLLIEDVFDWCQGWKKVEEVRTCWDLIVAEAKAIGNMV